MMLGVWRAPGGWRWTVLHDHGNVSADRPAITRAGALRRARRTARRLSRIGVR